ncbi:MAG: hypothetical protein R3A52_17875 [Polyangiales bacterium]
MSLPLAALFYGLFAILRPRALRPPSQASSVLGYLAYDYIHFAVHFFKLPRAACGRGPSRPGLKASPPPPSCTTSTTTSAATASPPCSGTTLRHRAWQAKAERE